MGQSHDSRAPGAELHEYGLDPGQLVREHIGWMLALAHRLLQDRELAEDAVQEAFVAAFRALPEFAGRSSLKTWLHRITLNAALMQLRRRKRLAELPIDELLPVFDGNECRIEPSWTSMISVEEAVQSAVCRERVAAALGEMPDAYRIVLQLRDIEGYDTAEVAELLDISEGNVKVRLHRARAALKRILEPLLRGEVS